MLRVGNASGFYGDRFSAVREMLEGGPLDVLTGDYLAELTMTILARERAKPGGRGYAKTFLRQMEECLALARARGVRIVANAGGLDPAGLAEAIRALATRLGLGVAVAHVEGDDLAPRARELGLGAPLAANAYLGGWGIAECLRAGADVVVTGRVTDASLVVGVAAAAFGWARDDWDRLAGATVAGHVLECGTQATGGNFSFFGEIDARRPGFPIAEIEPDGSFVVTKHAATGGAVTVETVTAQLLYEIGGPRYAGPDVTTRFDSLEVEPDSHDRVRVRGARGEPPPPTLKVSRARLAGFKNDATFVLVGLDIDAKAKLVREQLEAALVPRPAKCRWTLARTDREDAATEEEAAAFLRVAVEDADANVVGRAFSGAAIELALGSYPGFTTTAPPRDAQPSVVHDAVFVYATAVAHVAVLPDGTRRAIAPPPATLAVAPLVGVGSAPVGATLGLPPPLAEEATERMPLGRIVGARSGDKGGIANIGVWARSDDAWRWLAHTLTVEALRALLPETAAFPVERHLFPKLRAMNFVVDGILGEGVASSARFDPQGKALGEWLRSRHVDAPARLRARA